MPQTSITVRPMAAAARPAAVATLNTSRYLPVSPTPRRLRTCKPMSAADSHNSCSEALDRVVLPTPAVAVQFA